MCGLASIIFSKQYFEAVDSFLTGPSFIEEAPSPPSELKASSLDSKEIPNDEVVFVSAPLPTYPEFTETEKRERELLAMEIKEAKRELLELRIFHTKLRESGGSISLYDIVQLEVHRVDMEDIAAALKENKTDRAIYYIKSKIRYLSENIDDLKKKLRDPATVQGA